VLDLAAAGWLLPLLLEESEVAAAVKEALRRFAPAGKAHAGSASSRASCRPAVARYVAVLLTRRCSSDVS
jgi:2-keto-3-deoxy-L-rhamnonate aldolase RhmA